MTLNSLKDSLQAQLLEKAILAECLEQDMLTVELLDDQVHHVPALFTLLRDNASFKFETLTDLCGIDYLHYGIDEWATTHATHQGFERGVRPISLVHPNSQWHKPRLAIVYHLLSLSHNHRVRVRVFVSNEQPVLPSVTSIWSSANWYEREAFDLFGIIFEGHPDLRRILTDYGFVGHPFRKDFPVFGNVEVRFDKAQNRVLYEPVEIDARVLVPKVIREE